MRPSKGRHGSVTSCRDISSSAQRCTTVSVLPVKDRDGSAAIGHVWSTVVTTKNATTRASRTIDARRHARTFTASARQAAASPVGGGVRASTSRTSDRRKGNTASERALRAAQRALDAPQKRIERPVQRE